MKIQAIQHAGEIGAQAAKEGAKYALAISSVQNLSEVAKGELELSEAVESRLYSNFWRIPKSSIGFL